MREIRWYIDNIEFTPRDVENIGFRGDLRQNPEFAELSADRLLIDDPIAVEIITQHINTIGVFEGIPLRVDIDGYSLELFIDLLDNLIITDANSVNGVVSYEVGVKRRKGLDVFRERAKGLSWRAVNRTNPIPTFDVPFLIIRDNQAELLISLIIATFVLVKETIEAVKRLVEETAELIQVSITDPVVGVGGGVVVKVGAIIKQALVVVAVLAYVVLLSLAVRALIEQILDIIFPKIRNFKAVKVRDLMLKLCEKTGYTLQSNLLNELSNLTILPIPAKSKSKSWWEQLQSNITEYYNEGYPTEQDTVPNGLALIEFIESWFNAEVRASNGIVRIETKGFFENAANVVLNHNLNDQNEVREKRSPNNEEIWKRYLLRYSIDVSDTNTMDYPDGSGVEYDTSPIVVNNEDLVSIERLDERVAGFSLGRRKDDYTFLENEARKIAQEADKVVSALGGNSNLVGKIQKRIGVLQISQPFFGNTKLMWTVGGRQPQNYLNFIGANAIYKKYHVSNEYKVNSKDIYTDMPTQFDPRIFAQFFENRFVQLNTGETVEIYDYEMIPEQNLLTVTYAKVADYGNNTKTTLIHE